MATTMAQLFGPLQGSAPKGPLGSGDLMSQAGQAIAGATTKSEGNSFDTIVRPLRQRRRRQIAQELQKDGLTPSDGNKYFERFRDKLMEFGDAEGAEIVEAKRMEMEDRELAQQKIKADTAKSGAQTEGILADITREDKKFDFTQLTTMRELDLAERELNNKIAKTDNDVRRIELEEQKVALQARRDEVDAIVKRAQANNLDARTEETDALRPGRVAELTEKVKSQELANDITSEFGADQANADLDKAMAAAEKTRAETKSIKAQRDAETKVLEARAKRDDAAAAANIAKATNLESGLGDLPSSRKVTEADRKRVQSELSGSDTLTDFLPDGIKAKKAFTWAVAAEVERLRISNPGFERLERKEQLRRAAQAVQGDIARHIGNDDFNSLGEITDEGVPSADIVPDDDVL